jgi:hypothetical protein
MLLDGRPEDDEDPAEEPPEDPPEPPDGRDTALPVVLPFEGRDSGRSFACRAHAGATLSASAAAVAHEVTARRVIGVLLCP